MATLLETHAGEWTPADLDVLPEHWKVELLDGTLIVNAQPMPVHIVVGHRLVRILGDSLGDDYELLPSTAAIDRTIKAERYAAAGIPGYWRVELDPITVIAYSLREGTYAELGSWSAGETVEVEEPLRVSVDPAVLLP